VKRNFKKRKTSNYLKNQSSETPKQKNRVLEFIKRGLIASFSFNKQFFINGIALFNIKGAAVETIAPYGITELYVPIKSLILG
jgi:hypothetical protein